MLQHGEHVLAAEFLRYVFARTAADWEDRPQRAEDDQQHEGDDVVGHGMEAHRDHAEQLEHPALAVVAGQSAEQIAQAPRNQRAGEQKPHRPGQRPSDQHRDGRWEGRKRGSEIHHEQALPIGGVLLEHRTAGTVEFTQRLAHHQHRFRAGIPEGGDMADRLLDGIDRRQMGHEEGERNSDEDDQRELTKALQHVNGVASHWLDPHRV